MTQFNINNQSFLEEEYRSGYLVSRLMKQVWACELDLLNEFLRVCEKYKLKCWADSGTLIGTIRHKGFIPWDDDIDMVMLREDYDKLVKIAPLEFKEPYFLQTIYSDYFCSHRHGQLHNIQTAALPTNNYKKKCCQGIFIDIFILDGYPNSVRTAFKHVKKVRLKKNLIKLSLILKKYIPRPLYKKCRFDLMFFRSYEKTLRQFNINNSDYLAYISLNLKENIKNKDFYSQTLYSDFEYIKIPIPIGYDNILRIDFGDYMTPKKEPTMHGSMDYNVERSYKEILKELHHS
ncbi:LicD family protein [Bacteroidaceae bacterium HV4-6-C5C]|jgi:lipopolysaccharide cholinephosphotransferase|nr:LicD family protein [Bacteroidaceae bacterium HV4-6-C5C]